MGEPFNLTIAQKLPTLTCEGVGKRSEINCDFLSNIELYHETLTDVGKATLIICLLKYKIQGKILTELGSSRQTTIVKQVENHITNVSDSEIGIQGESATATLTAGNEIRSLSYLKKVDKPKISHYPRFCMAHKTPRHKPKLCQTEKTKTKQDLNEIF